MLFHTRHTINIGNLAIMLDAKDQSKVKRLNIPLPKKMVKKAYEKLLIEVNETLNKTALERELESGVLRVKLYNKAFNLYPALVTLVSLTWDQEHRDKIKEITGIELVKLEDRESLINETKRLQDKYKELIVKKSDDGVSFSQVIISTEIVLDFSISRNIKLFEFQYYMKAASDKIKQLEARSQKG